MSGCREIKKPMTSFKEKFLREHQAPSERDKQMAEIAPSVADIIWEAENVEMVTVGIDIGSSTSHLMFARVHMQRQASGLSSKFVLVGRDMLWRSPILLTPYLLDENTIDVKVLEAFIEESFKQAGLARNEIDSGAVILTGMALRRSNAEAIAHLFAQDTGKFVCASAGHHLECVMAAHGAGTVSLSRARKKVMMNIDIGGGTTKLALVKDGKILATAAFEVGGRLIAYDENGIVTRIEEPALRHAARAGVTIERGKPITEDEIRRIAEAEVEALLEIVLQKGTGAADDLLVTPALPVSPKPEVITFSGGVAEFIFGRETEGKGDLGKALGTAVMRALEDKRLPYEVADPGQGIRATVIGASQFSVEVSGNTIHVSANSQLPLRNVPVLYPDVDLTGDDIDQERVTAEIRRAHERFNFSEGDQAVALAFHWDGPPAYTRLKPLADGITGGLPQTVKSGSPIIVMFDEDIGKTMGSILRNECDVNGDVLSIDGINLTEFDYIDIGEVIQPTNVVPLVVKSLLFATPDENA
jgi:ethanolamine utilization protein EutA